MEEIFKRVLEARKEALKNQIAVNTILINEKLGIVKKFSFDNNILPPMICGMEVKVTDELPENVSFAITEVEQTERSKLIEETEKRAVKSVLQCLSDDIRKEVSAFMGDKDFNYGLSIALNKIESIAEEYRIEIDK